MVVLVVIVYNGKLLTLLGRMIHANVDGMMDCRCDGTVASRRLHFLERKENWDADVGQSVVGGGWSHLEITKCDKVSHNPVFTLLLLFVLVVLVRLVREQKTTRHGRGVKVAIEEGDG